MPGDQSQLHKHRNPEYCYNCLLKRFEYHLSQTHGKTKFTLLHKKKNVLHSSLLNLVTQNRNQEIQCLREQYSDQQI